MNPSIEKAVSELAQRCVEEICGHTFNDPGLPTWKPTVEKYLRELAAQWAKDKAGDDWTGSLIDRLNELVRENRTFFSECSDGHTASQLIQAIHGMFNYTKHERDQLLKDKADLEAQVAGTDRA